MYLSGFVGPTRRELIVQIEEAEVGWSGYTLEMLKGTGAMIVLSSRRYRAGRRIVVKSRGLVNGVRKEEKEATVNARCSKDHRNL